MLQKSLKAFLEEVAAKTSAPGGGAVAAIAAALAAALAAMTARFSEGQLGAEARDVARRSDEISAAAARLAEADAEAYGAYLAARRRPDDDPEREPALAEAASRSAEVPLRIAELGAEVDRIAERLGERGNPNLGGDAFAARSLARAATRAAANLVLVNLGDEDDARVARARELLEL